TGWAILSLILLVLLAITIIVWYLPPDRLTPIVEREASAMIDGHIKVSRVELTFWSTFPRLRVDIDSLQVISHSTHHLPDSIKAGLPPYTDSLLSVDHMHGTINLMSLAEGNIELYDLLIRHPQANIVIATDGSTNLDIIPAADSSEPTVEQPAKLPAISLDHFRLMNAGPLTYTSTADSTFLAISLENISLDGVPHPVYQLGIDGNATSPLLDRYRLTPLTAGLDGKITWDPGRPAAVSVSDLDITVNGFNILMNADIDASHSQGTLIEKLDIRLSQIDLNNIVEHLPRPMASKLSKLDTDMKIDASARLLTPYLIADSMTIPSVEATLSVSPSRFHLGNIHMDNVDMEIKATVDGEDIDRSTIDIDHFILRGLALDIN
ncbi:MAG: AsmA family protein, partial [Muribaculaceae bacterium]|nr:AsmA family protein [Muribaculaceae bacterium]